MRFFAIDGTKNQKVHSVFLPDLPVHSAAWVRGGDEVIITGRRPFFYAYDALSGNTRKITKLGTAWVLPS